MTAVAGRRAARRRGAGGDREPPADLRLVEAIGWYTGTRGLVDEAKARTLIETAAFEEQRAGADVAGPDVLRAPNPGLSQGRGQGARHRRRPRRRGAAAGDGAHRRGGVLDGHRLRRRARRARKSGAAAFEWFSKAAAAGHTLAEHNLGNAYATGRGVAADLVQAVAWWLKAATKGDAVPQLRLGEAYEAGRGVARSLDEARRWYGDAARRGNADAAGALKRLAGE